MSIGIQSEMIRSELEEVVGKDFISVDPTDKLLTPQHRQRKVTVLAL